MRSGSWTTCRAATRPTWLPPAGCPGCPRVLEIGGEELRSIPLEGADPEDFDWVAVLVADGELDLGRFLAAGVPVFGAAHALLRDAAPVVERLWGRGLPARGDGQATSTRGYPTDVVLRPLAGAVLERVTFIATRAGSYRSPLTEVFRAALLEAVSALGAPGLPLEMFEPEQAAVEPAAVSGD